MARRSANRYHKPRDKDNALSRGEFWTIIGIVATIVSGANFWYLQETYYLRSTSDQKFHELGKNVTDLEVGVGKLIERADNLIENVKDNNSRIRDLELSSNALASHSPGYKNSLGVSSRTLPDQPRAIATSPNYTQKFDPSVLPHTQSLVKPIEEIIKPKFKPPSSGAE